MAEGSEVCGRCGKPIVPTPPYGGWQHADAHSVHGHAAKGPKRMTVAELKAQREEVAGGDAD